MASGKYKNSLKSPWLVKIRLKPKDENNCCLKT